MGGMPYMVQKGPFCTYADDRYTRASVATRIDWLNKLQDKAGNLELAPATFGALITDLNTLEASLFATPPAPITTQSTPIAHLNRDWFGLNPPNPASGGTTSTQPNPPQTLLPPVDSPAPQPTGWWVGWTGDAHEMMRVALVSALEASLGLKHRDRGATYAVEKVRRCWPIEFFWVCPVPKFEVFVSWRDHDAWWKDLQPLCRVYPGLFKGGGQVTVHILTPGATGSEPVSELLSSGALIDQTADYREHSTATPLETTHPRGLWVIGSDVETVTGVATSTEVEAGAPDPALRPNTGHVVSNATVRVVRPSEENGGVLNKGRTHPNV